MPADRGHAGAGDRAGDAATEHSLVVPRTARYYTLGPTHGFPRELWLVVHGYGQLAGRFIRQFAPIDDGTRLIVAPEALSRFYLDPIPMRRHDPAPRIGASWMTREDRLAEIADHVAYLDLLLADQRRALAGAAPRVMVLGFSQGTATVARWLSQTVHRVDQVVMWGGAIPPEIELPAWAERLEGAPLTLVAGDADELVSPALVAAEAERLSAAGVAFSMLRHPGGHAIEAGALGALAHGFAHP